MSVTQSKSAVWSPVSLEHRGHTGWIERRSWLTTTQGERVLLKVRFQCLNCGWTDEPTLAYHLDRRTNTPYFLCPSCRVRTDRDEILDEE